MEADDELLAGLLADLADRPAVRRAAALAELGWTYPGRAVAGVLPYLDDPDVRVRIAAAQARWQTAGVAEELDRLVDLVAEGLDGPGEEVRLMAGTALVNMEEAAVGPLVRRFDRRGGADALVVRVIGEIGGPEARAFLARAAVSNDPAVAAEAEEALAMLEEE